MAVASGNQDIHVSMPGTVLSYDAATQTAKVQPGIRRVIFDEDDQQVPETIPPFENVPVMHYRCAAFSIHANLAPGDGVDLVFGSDSMAEWRQGAETIATPGDLKRLGLSSPKAYPGLFPKSAPGSDHDNSIGTPGGLRVHFGTGAISIGGGANFAALANLVTTELNKIKTALSTLTCASAPGPVVAGTPYSTVGAVASSNLKAD
jgi:hypothetical protein